MKFLSLYRISFYLMLFLATLTMSVDATESPVSKLFPIAVAAASFLAYFTVDQNAKLGVARPLANVVALASVGLVAFEYFSNTDLLLIALGHFLVYLQLVKMFLPKTTEDDWFLFLLGLIQVMVGAVISQSDQVGLYLFSWAFMAIWVLALFSLHRDAARFQTTDGHDSVPLDGMAQEPYPGLIDPNFLLAAVRVMCLTLALGGVIFLAMPRSNSSPRSQLGNDPMGRHLTGFDEEIQIGQLGEILENDSVVMSIETFDGTTDVRIKPAEEPLWRGVTMAVYENGRWQRQKRSFTSLPIFRPKRGRASGTIRQQIKLEANDSMVLFGLRPMLKTQGPPRNEPELNPVDGTIFRPDPRPPGSYDYIVYSDRDDSLTQPGEGRLNDFRKKELLELSPTLRTRLRGIAEPLVKNIPLDQISARARKIEAYLRDSGKFSYTLRNTIVDSEIDPVEDFLINRQEGHCEYFASALVLMLRSIDIPARVVNGFKGGDWNSLAQVMSVRQKHAHSWVEAYLNESPKRAPVWLTLDPTPANERQRSVDQVGGVTANFRQVTDLVRYAWIFFVVGYNSDRQNRILYTPIRELIRLARNGFSMMEQAARPALTNLFHFQSPSQFISKRGFIITFVGLLVLALLIRVGVWVMRRILRLYRGAAADDSSLAAGSVFFRRLTQVLAEYGIEHPPAETQAEFARRATFFLSRNGAIAESVAEVPHMVVDAFYRVRFGHFELAPATQKRLEEGLDALEASLRASQA